MRYDFILQRRPWGFVHRHRPHIVRMGGRWRWTKRTHGRSGLNWKRVKVATAVLVKIGSGAHGRPVVVQGQGWAAPRCEVNRDGTASCGVEIVFFSQVFGDGKTSSRTRRHDAKCWYQAGWRMPETTYSLFHAVEESALSEAATRRAGAFPARGKRARCPQAALPPGRLLAARAAGMRPGPDGPVRRQSGNPCRPGRAAGT